MLPNQIKNYPEQGCYISGMVVKGACWNNEKMMLVNADCNTVYNEMPVLHMIPVCV